MGRNGWIYLVMFGIILVSFSIVVYHTHNKDYLIRKRIVPPGYFDEKDEEKTVQPTQKVYSKPHAVEEIPANMTESDDFFSDLFDRTNNTTSNETVLSNSTRETQLNSSISSTTPKIEVKKEEIKNIQLLNTTNSQTTVPTPKNESTEKNLIEEFVETTKSSISLPDKSLELNNKM